MAITAILSLSTPRFLPSSSREVSGCRRNIQNSFLSTFFGNKTFIGRAISHSYGNFGMVASVVGRKSQKRGTIIPDPDYRIPVALLGFSGVLVYQDNLLPAATVGLLGLLLLFQIPVASVNITTICNDTDVCREELRDSGILSHTDPQLYNKLSLCWTTRVRFVFDEEALEVKVGEQLQESGENVFVGGKNRWKYSTFVNWEFWWPNFPILVYFKETQTKPEGQIHFFPIIFNGKQLYDVMVERAGPSKTSGPNQS
eukprot:TRINITY_DN1250_c0_g1_i2.p1 TRINITY_DN1250_c0_g1~~TRINITY_DN1250_c0_g1_i2.p1  ORF type:complete len:256 (-),score=29.99 TRINITY_DN1250_c0_g1_i2:209-976(-)